MYVIRILESLYKIQKAEEGCLEEPTTRGSMVRILKLHHTYIMDFFSNFI